MRAFGILRLPSRKSSGVCLTDCYRRGTAEAQKGPEMVWEEKKAHHGLEKSQKGSEMVWVEPTKAQRWSGGGGGGACKGAPAKCLASPQQRLYGLGFRGGKKRREPISTHNLLTSAALHDTKAIDPENNPHSSQAQSRFHKRLCLQTYGHQGMHSNCRLNYYFLKNPPPQTKASLKRLFLIRVT